MIPVWWLTNHDGIDSYGPWDAKIVEELCDGLEADFGWQLQHHLNVNHIDPAVGTRGIVVVPVAHHTSLADITWLNEELAKLTSAVLFLNGDEVGIFPWRQVRHDNCRFWFQHPHPDIHRDMDWARFYGCGNPHQVTNTNPPDKTINWSFSGQMTHPVRRSAVAGMRRIRPSGVLITTEGFSQGLPLDEYVELMRSSKVVMAPSGPDTPDTFRFYEALEAGAVPIVSYSPPDGSEGYWQMVYGEDFPFPIVDDWAAVGGWVERLLKSWPVPGNQAMAWWLGQKRRMVQNLDADLRALKCEPDTHRWQDDVTVILTTSPIPSHPSTAVLQETLDSMRASMGVVPHTIIACDGVRREQSDLAEGYNEYVRRVCWAAMSQYTQTTPIVAVDHQHQIRMTAAALAEVRTPLVLFMEHDTPFTSDPIDWEACVSMMRYGALDALRFYHESHVPDPHRYLMIDRKPVQAFGVPVMRTRQWSQRPHLASTAYYRRIIAKLARGSNNGFIEDAHYSDAVHFPDDNRVGIYAPEGTMQRTYHADGRAGGLKYDWTTV